MKVCVAINVILRKIQDIKGRREVCLKIYIVFHLVKKNPCKELSTRLKREDLIIFIFIVILKF